MKSISRILLTIFALGVVPCVAAEHDTSDMDKKSAELRANGRDKCCREKPCPTTRSKRVRRSSEHQQKKNNS